MPEVECDEALTVISGLLAQIEDAIVLADPLKSDCPVTGASPGFLQMTGYSENELLGSNCRLLLNGVPDTAISRSTRQNLRDFCSQCSLPGVVHAGEAWATQPNARKDGTVFVNFFALRLLRILGRPFVLSAHVPAGEGAVVRMSADLSTTLKQEVRNALKRAGKALEESAAKLNISLDSVATPSRGLTAEDPAGRPDFRFYHKRLQDHCLLFDDGYTAQRREPEELPIGCLVFSDRNLKPLPQGFGFSVRVHLVSPGFKGLPQLGLTRRKPVDEFDLFPAVTKCLGQSCLIGSTGEATCRDQESHFVMRFKSPPPEEVETWSWQPGRPRHLQHPPANIAVGDILDVLWTWDGHLQLYLNDRLLLSFDIQRKPDPEGEYYAVVDCCFSAAGLSLVRSKRQLALPDSPGLQAFPPLAGRSGTAGSCHSQLLIAGRSGTAMSRMSSTPAQLGGARSAASDEDIPSVGAFRSVSHQGYGAYTEPALPDMQQEASSNSSVSADDDDSEESSRPLMGHVRSLTEGDLLEARKVFGGAEASEFHRPVHARPNLSQASGQDGGRGQHCALPARSEGQVAETQAEDLSERGSVRRSSSAPLHEHETQRSSVAVSMVTLAAVGAGCALLASAARWKRLQ